VSTIFCILALLTTGLQNEALSTTWYCDPVSGNTASNDGLSIGTAWGTLQSAVDAGKFNGTIADGDTVKLLSGYHGQFTTDGIQTQYKENSIGKTIEAADGATPQLRKVTLKNSIRWTFRGLSVSPSYAGTVTNHPFQTGYSIFYGYNNSYITIEDCNIFTVDDTSSWNENDWTDKPYNGIYLDYNTTYLTCRNNTIRNIMMGYFSGGNALFENNTIDGWANDGMRIKGPNTTVRDNTITNVYDTNGVYQIHSDAIQIPNYDYASNMTIVRNYIHAKTDPNRTPFGTWVGGTQGMFFSAGTLSGLIANNVIAVTNPVHGITLGKGAATLEDLTVINNTVLRPYNYGDWPDIYIQAVGGTRDNVVIRNNIADNLPASGGGVTVDHNFDISSYNPNDEFVDYANGDIHLAAVSNFIDAGSSLEAPAEDLDGNSRPQDQGYDVGAYENILVNSGNAAPVLQQVGNRSINENDLLTFIVNATDADGDAITYSAQNLPSGATFSGQSFSWTPSFNQAGSYQVTFIASDGQAQDSETITITVNNVNRLPVLAAIGDKSVDENSTLSFSVSASDADGDNITYSVQTLPSGATFASPFTWTPSYSQAGAYQVTFTASDGLAQDSETITITVNNVNRAPVLSTISDKSVYLGDSLNFAVDATDPDSDSLTYSAQNIPSGATFTNRTFSWTPSESQVASYNVTFVASDGQLQDSEQITITVNAADTLPPSVTNISPASGSIQVPLNSLATLHITDAGKGVDANSVTIKVNNNTVYTSNTAHYSSAYGDCRRSGTSADYAFTYQSSELFRFNRRIRVTVNATDLAGNVMNEYSYSFRTEMRSFGKNKPVSSSADTFDKGRPVTARDSSGNIWAAWQAGPAGNRDIYVSKLTTDAENFSSSVQLTNSIADQYNTAIAISSDDKLYIVWQDNRRGNWDIYLSTSSDGASWSTATRVVDSNDNEVNPAIAIDNQSPYRAYITWQDDRGGNYDIYVASSNNNFATSTTSRITLDSSNQIQPDIAIDSDNTVYVVWTDERNSSNDIYAVASNSGPWTNVPIVTNASDQSEPAIATEDAGPTLHLLWVDGTPGNKDIYYATSNGLPASPLTGSSIIDDGSGTDQLDPTIDVTGSTGNSLSVFAGWQDWRNVAGNSSDTDLYFAELSSDSWTNVLIGDDSTNANQSEPAMGVDSYGHPYLVWTDSRNSNTEIYYAGSTFTAPTAVASKEIPTATGAIVGTNPNAIDGVEDVSVTVPANAYPSNLTITISEIRNSQAFAVECLAAYDFGPSGTEFSQPVTVTIPYIFSSSGSSATPYWFNALSGALSQQGITDIQDILISPTLHALQFKTTHFTPFYLLLGSAAAAATGGGGGGGGCSLSVVSEGSIVEFLLPYIGLAVVMVVLKLRDIRNRRVYHYDK